MPDSAMISSMVVAWKPSLEKHFQALTITCRLRVSHALSLSLGISTL